MTESVILDPFDTFTYAIIGPISMIASFLLILAHSWYKELRQKPGDLILMIAVSEFFLSLHWTTSAVYTSWITFDYDDDSIFCLANSYVAVTAATLDSLYNIWFMCYIWFAIRSSLSACKWKQAYVHLISFVITGVVVLFKRNQLGRNSNGTCSTMLTVKDMITGSYLILFTMAISSYVYYSTKKYLAFQGSQQSRLRRDFLNYYGSYIKALVSISSLYFISTVIQAMIKIRFGDTHINDIRGPWGVALNVSKIGNCVKVLMPTLMFFIRIRDPLLSKLVFNPLRKDAATAIRSHRVTAMHSQLPHVDLNLHHHNSASSSDTETPLRKEKAEAWTNELLTLEDREETSWINLVPTRQKEHFARTMLASLYHYFSGNMRYQSGIKLVNSGKITKNAAKELDSCTIKGEKMMADLNIVESILNCKVTFYAPRLFKHIIVTAPSDINFRDSLSLEFNAEVVSKMGKSQVGDGGASGELMFCTHDSRLIAKTITKQEYRVFKAILFKYTRYVMSHPNTLICRKFALVQLQLTDIGKSVYFVLMENLFWFNSSSILRKYDLKGSTYGRKVLPEYDDFDKMKKCGKTLKDIDFINIEREVSFKETSGRSEFIRQVKLDSMFFKRHMIIDYSMILAVVDRNKVDMVEASLKIGSVRLIKTAKEGIVVVAGIIDYFQLFTIGKSAERFFKRLIKCNPNLETSSQPPPKYYERFIDFTNLYFKYSSMSD